MEHIEITPKQRQYVGKIRLFLNGQDITNCAFWAKVPSDPGVEACGSVKYYAEPRVIEDGRLKSFYETGNVYWVWRTE